MKKFISVISSVILMIATASIASAKSIKIGDYVSARAKEVCNAGANQMALAQIVGLLENAPADTGCRVYSLHQYATPEASQTITFDGYNGPVLRADFIGVSGPTLIGATTIPIRADNKLFCAEKNGDILSVVYRLSASSAVGGGWSRIWNDIASKRLDRTVVLEFDRGHLSFVGDQDDMFTYLGGSVFDYSFACGVPVYAK